MSWSEMTHPTLPTRVVGYQAPIGFHKSKLFESILQMVAETPLRGEHNLDNPCLVLFDPKLAYLVWFMGSAGRPQI